MDEKDNEESLIDVHERAILCLQRQILRLKKMIDLQAKKLANNEALITELTTTRKIDIDEIIRLIKIHSEPYPPLSYEPPPYK